jgi:hypothetical protein
MQLSLSNQEADRECITAHTEVMLDDYAALCSSGMVESDQ